MPPFTGFQPEAIQFLVELQANNDRAWFQPRKAEYERLLKEPLEALCLAVGERFGARGIPLQGDQRSPFRIYRDVRFSKDKSPYKTYVSATFPYVEPGTVSSASHSDHAVGGYIHLSPDEFYLGGGMWHPERDRLNAWRRMVVGDRERVHAAVGDPAFVATLGEVSGESLQRVPPGYRTDDPDAALLRLKDVTFGRAMPSESAFSADLPDQLADTFAAATPLLQLLAGLPS